MPYVFQSMDIIRSNYSNLSPYAQEEAPSAPEYPYSKIMAAYRGAIEAIENSNDDDDDEHEHIDLDNNNNNNDKSSNNPSSLLSSSSSSNSKSNSNSHLLGMNHTKAFQQILSHFFGDYFTEDADEEMASDIAERWTSFARKANPNYDGSRAEWKPWGNTAVNSTYFFAAGDDDDDDDVGGAATTARPPLDENDDEDIDEDDAEFDYWTDFMEDDEIADNGLSDFHLLLDSDDELLEDYRYEIDQFEDPTIIDESSSSNNNYNNDQQQPQQPKISVRDRFYRRRALTALQMEIVKENVFETQLRRIDPNKVDGSNSGDDYIKNSNPASYGWLIASENERLMKKMQSRPMSKLEAKEAIRFAQQLGLLGLGLGGEDLGGGGSAGGGGDEPEVEWEPFFPELMELTWPPEGRLIERDCTCDFWDRIRYRY